MVLLRGTPAAFNYTYGPALLYQGPRSIDEIYRQGEPVVVIADLIPIEELRKIELTRVRGFVLEEGDPSEEDLFSFFMNENRATVIGCKGILDAVSPGQWVIVDGVEGVVCVDPTPEVLAEFQETRRKGAPKRDEADEAAKIVQTVVEGVDRKRADRGASGELAERALAARQAVAEKEEPPGLILQILAGLPLPGMPGAEPEPPGEEAERPEAGGEKKEGSEGAQARRGAQELGVRALPSFSTTTGAEPEG